MLLFDVTLHNVPHRPFVKTHYLTHYNNLPQHRYKGNLNHSGTSIYFCPSEQFSALLLLLFLLTVSLTQAPLW